MKYFVQVDGKEFEVVASKGTFLVTKDDGTTAAFHVLDPHSSLQHQTPHEVVLTTREHSSSKFEQTISFACSAASRDEGGAWVAELTRAPARTRATVETERDRLRRRLSRENRRRNSKSVKSPLPGVVRRIGAKVGDRVDADQVVVTLEAMKMENEFRAESAGTITQLPVTIDQTVETGELLFELKLECEK